MNWGPWTYRAHWGPWTYRAKWDQLIESKCPILHAKWDQLHPTYFNDALHHEVGHNDFTMSTITALVEAGSGKGSAGVTVPRGVSLVRSSSLQRKKDRQAGM
jgi:hypothetical protein